MKHGFVIGYTQPRRVRYDSIGRRSSYYLCVNTLL